MSMKQKIQDFTLLVKNNRKTQVATILGVGLLAAFIWAAMQPLPQRKVARKPVKEAKTDRTMANTEAYQDLLNRFTSDLKGTQDSLAKHDEEIKGIRKDLMSYDERTAAILSKILDKVSTQESAPQIPGAGGGEISVDPIALGDDSEGKGGPVKKAKGEGIETFGLKKASVAPPSKPTANRTAFVGVGDYVRVELMAGVNASTDGTPYPVLFKVIGDVLGPDGSRLPLGEAHVVAAAQGSLPDSRALFRLTDLSIRLPNGERKEFKIDGWIVGEDGIRGMSGVLKDKIGEAIGAATVLGATQAVGEGLAQSQLNTESDDNGNLTQTMNGDLATYAAGKAIAGGTKEWSNIINQRVKQLVPQVQVFSGRQATAIFAKSVEIDGLFEALQDEESNYAALD